MPSSARQAIPVVDNATAPEVDTDEVSAILAILDVALDAYRKLKALRTKLGGYINADQLVTFFADRHKHAEYSLTLWASAQQLGVKRSTSKYADGMQIRALHVVDGDAKIVSLLWPIEPQPTVEPIEPEVNANAIQSALRAPHWTNDATLTDEERAERERMEAGHA